MSDLILDTDYKNWLKELKSKIQQSQIKAALTVNSQLILLYWDMGRQIAEKQENAKWGSGFINQLSKDLKSEFPDMGGFAANNLRYCRSFCSFYNDFLICAQLVRKLESPQIESEEQNASEKEYLKTAQLVQQLGEKDLFDLIIAIRLV